MNRKDFQQLAEIRIAEAQALLALSPPRPDGAYYLAGYAVECALKAAIAKRTKRHDWPERKTVLEAHTHGLKELMRVAGIEDLLEQGMTADQLLYRNWQVVREWTEQSRYARHSRIKVRNLVAAIADEPSGVLTWIKDRW